MDTKLRTILKSLTYRLGGLVITTLAAWVITRRIEAAASIGIADTAMKLVAYYCHERAWLRVRFGRVHPPECEI